MPLAGHDAGGLLSAPIVEGNFNPRAPCGARPEAKCYGKVCTSFQSTCPLRGTTGAFPWERHPQTGISIHMPLAGHDNISATFTAAAAGFQSTCPLRGTTGGAIWRSRRRWRFQSTCPLRGTTMQNKSRCRRFDISIHVPLAGHDAGQNVPLTETAVTFQSTCPLRGTTLLSCAINRARQISIHVPLAGHDLTQSIFFTQKFNFNPRAPCGARRVTEGEENDDCYFNPRAPCGARLALMISGIASTNAISIHVPLAGHDIV